MRKGSDCESVEEGKKPPKVKLTLRLRPCLASRSPTSEPHSSGSGNVIDLSKDSDSDDYLDDSMSVDSSSDEEDVPEKGDVPWSLPPYPRRSISIPCYTPSIETYPSFPTVSPSLSMSSPTNGFRRSPSLPFSIASPPPDSEDEDDDHHISMTGSHQCSTGDIRTAARQVDPDWDLDFDSEEDHGDTETQWESPGPRSPSAPLVSFGQDVLVKQESRDVDGMLDLWEPLGSNIDGNRVVEVVAKAAAGLVGESASMSRVKVEELECWDWEETYGGANPDWYQVSPHIKQEDVESEDALVSGDDMSPTEYSPMSPFPSQTSPILSSSAPSLRRHSELTWKDVELLGPDSVHPHEFEDGDWQDGGGCNTVRARAKTQPFLPTFEADRTFSTLLTQRSTESPESIRLPECDDIVKAPTTFSTSLTSTALTQDSPAIPEAAAASSAPTRAYKASKPDLHDVVVVHTCQPCTPVISATQVEGEFPPKKNTVATFTQATFF